MARQYVQRDLGASALTSPLLLSRSEAARLLSVSGRRIGQLIEAGELPYVLIGKRRLVPHDALLDFVDRRQQRVQVDVDAVRDRVREIAARRRGMAA